MVDAIMCGGEPTDADKAAVEEFAEALSGGPEALRAYARAQVDVPGRRFEAALLEAATRPLDTKGNPLPCDRCSSTEGVRMLNSCRACGPVPLCAACRDRHAGEMCDDDELDGSLMRGTE